MAADLQLIGFFVAKYFIVLVLRDSSKDAQAMNWKERYLKMASSSMRFLCQRLFFLLSFFWDGGLGNRLVLNMVERKWLLTTIKIRRAFKKIFALQDALAVVF